MIVTEKAAEPIVITMLPSEDELQTPHPNEQVTAISDLSEHSAVGSRAWKLAESPETKGEAEKGSDHDGALVLYETVICPKVTPIR